MAVYALSIHADYRCQHSGVCCSSDWDVPVELPLYRSLDAALGARRLPAAADAAEGDPPLNGSLAAVIAALCAPSVNAPPHPTLELSLALHAEVLAAVPEDLAPIRDEQRLGDAYVESVLPEWSKWHAPLKRYLATKAFASWTAYQARGVLTIVRGLEASLALVRVEAARQCRHAGRMLDRPLLKEAIRQADFMLNHLAVRDDLAERWSRTEDME